MSKPADQRYTVAVDFDGVLHAYTTPWIDAATIPDPPVDGAIEWLHEISERFDVVILTTRGRTPEGCAAVLAWLEEHGAPAPELVTAEKVPALIYLDDRAIRFEGPGSFPTVDAIHLARPWNKRR
jgi:hypothetical protein